MYIQRYLQFSRQDFTDLDKSIYVVDGKFQDLIHVGRMIFINAVSTP